MEPLKRKINAENDGEIQKKILTMHEQGLSCALISMRLGMGPTAIRRRLVRAIQESKQEAAQCTSS